MNKEKYIEYIFKWLILLGIAFLVLGLWQGLELIMYKEITYRFVDDIIGIILTYSLYYNLMNFKNKS